LRSEIGWRFSGAHDLIHPRKALIMLEPLVMRN
jgi:hypothetical protein